MTDITTIQNSACEWSRARFPMATPDIVALKLAEETGEVASALLGLKNNKAASGSGDIGGEVADVILSALIFLGRFFPEIDIEEELLAKLAKLNDKNSGHRAALSGELTNIRANADLSDPNSWFYNRIGKSVDQEFGREEGEWT